MFAKNKTLNQEQNKWRCLRFKAEIKLTKREEKKGKKTLKPT